jgi:hypothetical protein
MSSPVPSVVNVPAVLDDTGPEHIDPAVSDPAVSDPTMSDDDSPDNINPATSSKTGSMTYDRKKNGYNLEWESRADFNTWLTHEQTAIGIEIQVSKTWASKSKQLYSTCETLSCARNRTGGKKNYVKKTTRERKIDSKRIEGGCPCFIQIKTYPHTNTILGKYNHVHSHPIGKDNLKYIRIRVSTHELIEVWVHYGVTDQEIVSTPFFGHDLSN